MLRESLRTYLADQYGQAIGTDEYALAASRREAWRKLADDLAIQGALLPEDLGGVGGASIEAMIIMEAMGEYLAPLPYLSSIVIAGRVLSAARGEAADTVMRALLAGEAIAALAHFEPTARELCLRVETTARRIGKGSAARYVLNGTKNVVHAGPEATHFIVSARTYGAAADMDGVSLFLIERDRAGLSIRDFQLIDGSGASDLQLENVEVSASELLGQAGAAGLLIEHALDGAVAAVCAEAVGCMRAVLEHTVSHLKQRHQFGQPLASFQALRHRVVDMYVKLEHSTSLAHAAAASVDDPRRVKWLLSAAKAYIGRAADFVGRYGVQLHGGIGMMNETPVARFFKRLVVIQRQYGSTDYHYDRFAQLAGVSLGEADILRSDSDVGSQVA